MKWVHAAIPALAAITVVAAFKARTDTSVSPQNTLTITAREFEFDAPVRIAGGVTPIRLINAGKQWHHAILVRLDEGKTAKDFTEALSKPGPFPAWATMVGGPNASDPAVDANATVMLKPGRYVLLCVVPDTDRAPHFAKGMIREIEVTAGPTTELPAAALLVRLSDYDFQVSKPITRGKHIIRVRNFASQPHELELVRLAPGKTVQDLEKWLATEAGPPPGSAIGGVAPLARGLANNLEVDFTPGNYAFVCFVPDVKDGKPHHVHGMVKGFTVQ